MSGAIMPDPFAMPAMVTVLARDLHLLEGALREGVGRHDRAGRRLESVGVKARDQIMDGIRDLAGLQRLTDDAGWRR